MELCNSFNADMWINLAINTGYNSAKYNPAGTHPEFYANAPYIWDKDATSASVDQLFEGISDDMATAPKYLAVKGFVNLGVTSVKSTSRPSALVSRTMQRSSILQRIGNRVVVRSGESAPLPLKIFDARGKPVNIVNTFGRELTVP